MHDNSSVKVLSLAAVAVFASVVFSFLLKNFTNYAHWAGFLVASCGALLVLALLAILMLAQNRKIVWIALLLSALGMSTAFLANFSLILLIGSLISFVIFFWAYQGVQSDLSAALKLRIWRTTHMVISYASSGIAIFSIMAYLSLFDFSDQASLKKTLEVAVRPLEPIVSQYVPNFSVRSSILQLGAGLLPEDLRLAPPEVKSQLIQQAADRLSILLGNYVKIPVHAGDKIIDILYKATIGKMLNYSPVIRNGILIAVGFIIFLLLKFALIFANWIGTLLAFGFFKVLLRSGFFQIKKESIEKETIVV
ncbi:MAG: hypothetical protein G01um101419_625 [Parcubacteria group bacterium Gr01-1014_19]|nr:MAG: hypothetical protein G01um101419_625 [Parcubacteria group bacterium Gr01-1014_19]